MGLAFRHAPGLVLREAVTGALVCTHVHPDAIDGAYAQAKAVARLATTQDLGRFDPASLLSELQGKGVTHRKVHIIQSPSCP